MKPKTKIDPLDEMLAQYGTDDGPRDGEFTALDIIKRKGWSVSGASRQRADHILEKMLHDGVATVRKGNVNNRLGNIYKLKQ